jgi:hypothetical protein
MLLLGSCVHSYRPAELKFQEQSDSFDRVLYALRDDYPSLAQVDREGFRIQSAWIACEDRGTPAQRRLSLFREAPGLINLVVEVRYLKLGVFGGPSWTSPQGHQTWEREILEQITAALQP